MILKEAAILNHQESRAWMNNLFAIKYRQQNSNQINSQRKKLQLLLIHLLLKAVKQIIEIQTEMWMKFCLHLLLLLRELLILRILMHLQNYQQLEYQSFKQQVCSRHLFNIACVDCHALPIQKHATAALAKILSGWRGL